MRDRLWRFASGRSSSVNNYIANSVANANAGDRDSFAFAPDTSYRGSRDTLWQNVNARVTWQVNAEEQGEPVHRCADRCSCVDSRALTAREASADFRFPWKRLVTATYTAPITSKILWRRLRSQARGLGPASLRKGWSSSSSSWASTIRRPASSIAARDRFMASMRFKAELMDDTLACRRVLHHGRAFKVGYQDHNGARSVISTSLPRTLMHIQRPDSYLDRSAPTRRRLMSTMAVCMRRIGGR